MMEVSPRKLVYGMQLKPIQKIHQQKNKSQDAKKRLLCIWIPNLFATARILWN